jgi:hypothetical protein
MEVAVIAIAVIVAGAVLGSFFKPTPEQTKPLTPEKPSGDAVPSGHHH